MRRPHRRELEPGTVHASGRMRACWYALGVALAIGTLGVASRGRAQGPIECTELVEWEGDAAPDVRRATRQLVGDELEVEACVGVRVEAYARENGVEITLHRGADVMTHQTPTAEHAGAWIAVWLGTTPAEEPREPTTPAAESPPVVEPDDEPQPPLRAIGTAVMSFGAARVGPLWTGIDAGLRVVPADAGWFGVTFFAMWSPEHRGTERYSFGAALRGGGTVPLTGTAAVRFGLGVGIFAAEAELEVRDTGQALERFYVGPMLDGDVVVSVPIVGRLEMLAGVILRVHAPLSSRIDGDDSLAPTAGRGIPRAILSAQLGLAWAGPPGRR